MIVRGITPACAGNSYVRSEHYRRGEDHPRVCGEQLHWITCLKRRPGSPPRVRGTGQRAVPVGRLGRITPACAGNSNISGARDRFNEDHPRVCGEQTVGRNVGSRLAGSPPRVRGTGDREEIEGVKARITPACAGNSFFVDIACYIFGDHPRVCGEQAPFIVQRNHNGGSPPRVRGTELDKSRVSGTRGITPACAGNSPSAIKSPLLT